MTRTLRPPTRVLAWDGCFNVRDLGGLPAGEGLRTRERALIRSDVPWRLTEIGRRSLLEHGVRTIVDLRTPEEVRRDGDRYPFREQGDGQAAIRYLSLPFTAGRAGQAWQQMLDAYATATTRAELNRIDLDGSAIGIGAVARGIAEAEPGGVLVHCYAGKDRTGLVVALLLSLVGVSDDDIADDYALTMDVLEPLIADWLLEMSDDPAEHVRLRQLAEPRREAMLDTLEHLRQRHGSAEEYLLAAGVRPDHLAQLRDRLLEG
jgi:protein-tyrosine phosphatase